MRKLIVVGHYYGTERASAGYYPQPERGSAGSYPQQTRAPNAALIHGFHTGSTHPVDDSIRRYSARFCKVPTCYRAVVPTSRAAASDGSEASSLSTIILSTRTASRPSSADTGDSVLFRMLSTNLLTIMSCVFSYLPAASRTPLETRFCTICPDSPRIDNATGTGLNLGRLLFTKYIASRSKVRIPFSPRISSRAAHWSVVYES